MSFGRRARIVAHLLVIAGVSVAARPGRAGEPTPSEALFRQGRADAERGDYKSACEKFARSRQLEPTIGATLNLADCREHLGDLVGAYDSYREVAAMMRADDSRAAFVQERAAALDPRIPRLTVKLAAGAPAGAQVKRGDVPLDATALGTPQRVNPGEHAIVVTAPGHKTALFTARLLEHDTKEMVVTVGELEPAWGRQPVAAPPAPAKTTQRAIGFVAGGLGIASLGVAAVSGVLFWTQKSSLDRDCPNGLCPDDATRSKGLSALRRLATVNTITTVAGAVALGTGAILVLTSKPARPTSALNWRVGPASASLDGSF